MMTVNVKSALYCMQEIIPHFKEKNSGHIVNVSSMLGRVPFATNRSACKPTKTRDSHAQRLRYTLAYSIKTNRPLSSPHTDNIVKDSRTHARTHAPLTHHPRMTDNGAKHYLNALTANIRAELAETHPSIAVTLVSPGAHAHAHARRKGKGAEL